MEWISIEDKFPKAGDVIIAKLSGCKICDYMFMTVREGEGLGHIEEWKYADDVNPLYKDKKDE